MSADEIVPESVGGEHSSNADALDGDQRSNKRRFEDSSSSSSSSSSSEDEEGIASPPPNKRRKVSRKYKQVQTGSDPRVETLIQQVGFISSYLSNLPLLSTQSSTLMHEQQQTDPIPSSSNYLNVPTTSNTIPKLSLGVLGTEFDEKTIVPQADKERLQELINLQKFDSPSWKGIRYKGALQSCIASPGFVGLKLNEELCHFNKTKDYLASTELLLAGLSNNILQQRQLLRSGLQELLDWTTANLCSINSGKMLEKMTNIFGPGSPSYKNSETAMQIVCGKRAECIEVRRERILKEIVNPNLKATLQSVPPSQEYLFSREALQPVIASLGGSQIWLNTPAYIKEKKSFNQSYASNKQHHSHRKTQNNRSDKKQNPRYKKNQPFRKNFTANNTPHNNNNKQ